MVPKKRPSSWLHEEGTATRSGIRAVECSYTQCSLPLYQRLDHIQHYDIEGNPTELEATLAQYQTLEEARQAGQSEKVSWLPKETSCRAYRCNGQSLWIVQHEYATTACPHCNEPICFRLTFVGNIAGRKQNVIPHLNHGSEMDELRRRRVQEFRGESVIEENQGGQWKLLLSGKPFGKHDPSVSVGKLKASYSFYFELQE